MASEGVVRCPECGLEVKLAPACSACGAVLNTEADPYCGKTLGRYHCLDRLGRGGTSFVYKAEHTKVGAYRALKVLKPQEAARERAVESIWSEARLAAQMRHPNLVVFHDAETSAEGVPYSIWDLADGPTILARVARSPMQAEITHVVSGLCGALEAIHAKGYAHLDLSPANVVLLRRGGAPEPMLVDFGEARRSGSPAERETEALRIGFSAPEQVLGGTVDARTDVFALGALIVFAATGHRFLDSRDLAAYAEDLKQYEPAKLPSLQSLSAGLRAVVERCLSPDPEGRPASVAVVRDAIRSTREAGTASRPGFSMAEAIAKDLTIETPLPGVVQADKSPPAPRARMEMVSGVSREPIELEEVVTFGRADGNRIIVDHPTVSKKHARIWVEDGAYHIEDLGSRNGTSVNGRRVMARKALRDGDTVGMGEVVFKFKVLGPR